MTEERDNPEATYYGDIEVVTNRHRQKAFVRVDKIAAIVEVSERGPTNLIFTNGGELEICGDAKFWRLQVAIVTLERAIFNKVSE